MNVQRFVFRKPTEGQGDVFIACEKDKYGLIVIPNQCDVAPASLNTDELLAQGGSFITQPQWDEIRPNVCFNPDDDVTDEVNEPDRITCNYYVLKDGRWGILDETGCMLQEPVYEEVIIVNNGQGLAESIIDSCLRHGFDYLDVGAISGRVLVRKGDKWGMLRGHADAVLPLVYDSIEIVCYHWASSNVYTVGKDGLYGVVDPYGKFFIPMEYPPLHCESLDYMWNSSVFRIDGEAGTGYVRLGDGKCLVTPKWERIDSDRLYLAPDDEPWGYIFTVWKGGRCGLILSDKGMIIPPVWDEIIPRRIHFRDPQSYSVRRGKQWGCCDESGHLICNAMWDEVGIYLNGIACVKKDGQWGAIGADGQLRVPVEWDEIEGFGIRNAMDDAVAHTNAGVLLRIAREAGTGLSNNLSWVRRNGLWGVIDTDGHIIAEPTLETHDDAVGNDDENS